jgi:hypothetical protein
MPSRPPGVLGTTQHGFGFSNHGGHPIAERPGPQGTHVRSSIADLEYQAAQLAHRVSSEIGWHGTRSATYNFLGNHSFTAGVVVGLGENLCQSVVMLVDLLKTLALSEYGEYRDGSTWQQLRWHLDLVAVPGVSLMTPTVALARCSIPHLDDKVRAAYHERQALFEAIRCAFSHREEVLGELTANQVAKAKGFAAYLDGKTLSSNYEAGKLFGELLLDLLLVIDAVAGIAKLAAKVPRFEQYTKKLANLANEMRLHRQLKNAADADQFADPLPKSETKPPIRPDYDLEAIARPGAMAFSAGLQKAAPPPVQPLRKPEFESVYQGLQAATLRRAAKDGVPFCEVCEKLAKRAAVASALEMP